MLSNTPFTSGANSLQNTDFTVPASPTVACDTGVTCTLASWSSAGLYPYTLPGAASKLIYAAPGSGLANQTFTFTWRGSLPANSLVGRIHPHGLSPLKLVPEKAWIVHVMPPSSKTVSCACNEPVANALPCLRFRTLIEAGVCIVEGRERSAVIDGPECASSHNHLHERPFILAASSDRTRLSAVWRPIVWNMHEWACISLGGSTVQGMWQSCA